MSDRIINPQPHPGEGDVWAEIIQDLEADEADGFYDAQLAGERRAA